MMAVTMQNSKRYLKEAISYRRAVVDNIIHKPVRIRSPGAMLPLLGRKASARSLASNSS
jgi:hypothetical protein